MLYKGELTKVFIFGKQDAAFGESEFHQLLVNRPMLKFADG